MDRPVRIAVVGPVDDRLVDELHSLPLRPDVHPLPSLVGGIDALARSQPDLLLIGFADEPAEDVGAVRLLQRLWPAVAVVVVAAPDREWALAPVAERLHARLFVYPDAPGQLAALLEQALQQSDRPPPQQFADLAHGLADEINNPLMFSAGHLQLIRAAFDQTTDRDRIDQIDAALTGLNRIRASVDRLRLLSQASGGPRLPESVDVCELVSQAVARRSAGDPAASVSMPEGPQLVRGDREQLADALAAIVQFGDELAAIGADCHLELERLDRGVRLRLTASGSGLADWQLPHSFEPYYPLRALRGQAHGLSLFVAQTVFLGHGGQASARRQGDGAVQFDFALPAR